MNGRFYNGDDDYDYHPYFGGGHPNLERGLIRRPKSPERPELPEYTKKYNRAMQAAKGQRAIDMKKAEAVTLRAFPLSIVSFYVYTFLGL